MKRIHHAWITVYLKPEEQQDSVRNAFLSLIPFNLEKEKLTCSEHKASIEEGRSILVLQLHLEKTNHTRLFLEHLAELLGKEQTTRILKQKQSRLDDNNHFFIRLDKPSLLEGKAVLTDGGNCFHIRMTIAAYPGTRDSALQAVDMLFS